MGEEFELTCARPTGGPVGQDQEAGTEKEANPEKQKKEQSPMIKIGKPIPDFSAPGYHKGKFVNVNLSDYLGKWVLLCFYPGDFTFV